MKPTETLNVAAWVAACRKQNKNTINNTAAGYWLGQALRIIESQFDEIQAIRWEQISETTQKYVDANMPEQNCDF